MKKSSVILLILFVVSGIFYYQLTKEKQEVLTYKLTRVIDGDTVELSSGDKVRLKGINAPETFMNGNELATNFLENFENKTVKIVSFGPDKYGRILGYLFYENKNLNLEILEQGFASLYYYEQDKYYKEMKSAEEFARMNELGIWKKSSDYGCLEIIDLHYKEPELLEIYNYCNKTFSVTLKDDATHIYEEKINPESLFKKDSSHIWNDEGDTVYVWDNEGLLIFYRY